jgi:hypothetical protein
MKHIILFILLAAAIPGAALAQDHGHLNVGAVSREPGSKLAFDNAADFSIESQYVKTLTFASVGQYASLYEGNITLTALHSLDPFGDPVPGGPLPGAFIVAEIVSVDGPAGGAFQFWETNSAAAPAVSIPSGSTNVNFRFELSEAALGAGEPGGDPFGHIHGRRFTATAPGIYTVSFRAMDTSKNGENGGALHSPSDVLSVHFEAGVNMAKAARENGQTRITFAAPASYSWQLQRAASLPASQWTDVADPVIGNDTFVEMIDDPPEVSKSFYRIVGQPVLP